MGLDFKGAIAADNLRRLLEEMREQRDAAIAEANKWLSNVTYLRIVELEAERDRLRAELAAIEPPPEAADELATLAMRLHDVSAERDELRQELAAELLQSVGLTAARDRAHRAVQLLARERDDARKQLADMTMERDALVEVKISLVRSLDEAREQLRIEREAAGQEHER